MSVKSDDKTRFQHLNRIHVKMKTVFFNFGFFYLNVIFKTNFSIPQLEVNWT